MKPRHAGVREARTQMKRRILACVLAAGAMYACAEDSSSDLGGGGPDGAAPPSGVVPDGGASNQQDGAAPNESGAGGTCGDGKLDPSEDCDDGNSTAMDGCSATCKRESTGPNDVCPGAAIALTGTGAEPRRGSVTGTTADVYSHYSGSCGGYQVKDAVYVVTPDVTGQLTAKLSGAFDSILYVRRSCEGANTEAVCNNAPGTAGGEEISITVTKDQPVFLFVDGVNATGTFTLDVEVAIAACGNGKAEAPEACDDGNSKAGDGCAPDCTLETTGNDLQDCPGQGVTLSGTGNAPRKISFAGSTSLMPSSTLTGATSGCYAGGPNTVYAITPDIDGSMKGTLVASYSRAMLHVRSDCDTVGFHSQLDCREAQAAFEPVESTFPVRAGQPYYLIVDSYSDPFHGPYVLDVVVSPSECGNKVLDGTEQCDDGNTAPGDGCSPACTLEPVNPDSNTCPGATLPLVAKGDGSHAGVITSSTATLTNKFAPKAWMGMCAPFNLEKDAAYVVTAPIDGLLTAKVSAGFDAMLYARDSCSFNSSTLNDLACKADVSGNGTEVLKVPVVANMPIFLVVDGQTDGAAGVFVLSAVITPGVCGNGVLEGGEQCDDNNLAAGDGCSPTCMLDPATSHDTCANAEPIAFTPAAGGSYVASVVSGTTNLAHDQTFTGCAGYGPDAIYTVTAPIDGVLKVEVPSAGFNVALGARSTCPASTSPTLPLVCSNATGDPGLEEISFGVTKDATYYVIVDGVSPGDRGPFTMQLKLLPPGCGDGLVSGSEACDDGNLVNGDGCSATCMFESLAGIDTCPGHPLALSGAGSEPRKAVLTLDTSTLGANYAGTCGGSAKEGVVAVTAPITGKLTAKLTGATHHAVLYARSACNDPKSEPVQATSTLSACDNDLPNPESDSREISFQVTAGTAYYLFLDGYNGGAGIASLQVMVTP